MLVVLHNPSSVAHLKDLRSRLEGQLTVRPHLADEPRQDDSAVVETLLEVVRRLDRGSIRTKDALEAFARHRVPGFSFGRWMAEMLEEGVYLEAAVQQAA